MKNERTENTAFKKLDKIYSYVAKHSKNLDEKYLEKVYAKLKVDARFAHLFSSDLKSVITVARPTGPAGSFKPHNLVGTMRQELSVADFIAGVKRHATINGIDEEIIASATKKIVSRKEEEFLSHTKPGQNKNSPHTTADVPVDKMIKKHLRNYNNTNKNSLSTEDSRSTKKTNRSKPRAPIKSPEGNKANPNHGTNSTTRIDTSKRVTRLVKKIVSLFVTITDKKPEKSPKDNRKKEDYRTPRNQPGNKDRIHQNHVKNVRSTVKSKRFSWSQISSLFYREKSVKTTPSKDHNKRKDPTGMVKNRKWNFSFFGMNIEKFKSHFSTKKTTKTTTPGSQTTSREKTRVAVKGTIKTKSSWSLKSLTKKIGFSFKLPAFRFKFPSFGLGNVRTEKTKFSSSFKSKTVVTSRDRKENKPGSPGYRTPLQKPQDNWVEKIKRIIKDMRFSSEKYTLTSGKKTVGITNIGSETKTPGQTGSNKPDPKTPTAGPGKNGSVNTEKSKAVGREVSAQKFHDLMWATKTPATKGPGIPAGNSEITVIQKTLNNGQITQYGVNHPTGHLSGSDHNKAFNAANKAVKGYTGRPGTPMEHANIDPSMF